MIKTKVRLTKREGQSYQSGRASKVKVACMVGVASQNFRFGENIFQDINSGGTDIWNDGIGANNVAKDVQKLELTVGVSAV